MALLMTALFSGHPPQSLDLDPAAPVGGGDSVPAICRYTQLTDGLARPWHGMVWLNPPFSNATVWAYRFIRHGNGIFLGPVANSRWCTDLMAMSDLMWLCRDFAFTHPTHAGRRSSMPLFFAAAGPTAVDGLRRLASSRRHPGVLVRREVAP
jgi:hypothetical protein